MASDDLTGVVRYFGDKIFVVHVRDIATKPQGPPAPEIEKRLANLGYLEVPFGSGEVYMVGTICALKDIHYKSQIYSEHFSAIADDHVASQAWPGPSAISAPSIRQHKRGDAGNNRPRRSLLSVYLY